MLAAIAVLLLLASAAEAVSPTPRAAICQTFRPCSPALHVARCESHLDRFAVGSAGERGLFQIHPVHFGWAKPRRLFESLYNARVAFRLSRGGRDWSAWSWRCRP